MANIRPSTFYVSISLRDSRVVDQTGNMAKKLFITKSSEVAIYIAIRQTTNELWECSCHSEKRWLEILE